MKPFYDQETLNLKQINCYQELMNFEKQYIFIFQIQNYFFLLLSLKIQQLQNIDTVIAIHLYMFDYAILVNGQTIIYKNLHP
ncbi:hypothetical protein pb186bvf_019533 [Paramecium bursaria]